MLTDKQFQQYLAKERRIAEKTQAKKEAAAKAAKPMRAGKNVWVNLNGDRVRSETRPEDNGLEDCWYVPCIPRGRVTGASYTPYHGTSQWERMANAAMADEAQANFQRGQR